MPIAESDWRLFKPVRMVALDRFCHQILSECRIICDDGSLTAHDRCRKLSAHIHRRDKAIERAFDDFRRTTAVICLATMCELGLITGEELDHFSVATRAQVIYRTTAGPSES